MMHIEISTRKNLYVTVRTTKSFGGNEYSQTQAETAEISARKLCIDVPYYQIQKVQQKSCRLTCEAWKTVENWLVGVKICNVTLWCLV